MSIKAITEATEEEMARTPGSAVTMCHDQTRTAAIIRAENAILIEERE